LVVTDLKGNYLFHEHSPFHLFKTGDKLLEFAGCDEMPTEFRTLFSFLKAFGAERGIKEAKDQQRGYPAYPTVA
jgi:hypothetical protein